MGARTPLPSLAVHLQSTRTPWSALLVLKAGQRTESLIDVPHGFVMKVLRGVKCRTSTGLFAEFARALDFPDYFGHNWDALEECLADLDWLPAKGYVLLLTEAEQVLPEDEEDYATFLEVLNDAGEAWGSGQAGLGSKKATPFHTIFAITEREKLTRRHWGLQEIETPSSREPAPRRRTSRQSTSRRQKGR